MGTVPMISCPSGATIAQLPAILITLSEELGLAPTGASAKAKHSQLILDANDLFVELCGKKGQDRFDKWFAYLEKTLANAGTGYFVGSTVTPADFFMYWSMQWIKKRGFDFSTHEKFNAWLAKMDAEP